MFPEKGSWGIFGSSAEPNLSNWSDYPGSSVNSGSTYYYHYNDAGQLVAVTVQTGDTTTVLSVGANTPTSIIVNGRELNPDHNVLQNPHVRENIIKLYAGIVGQVGNTNFTFEVSGGDRYVGKDARHYSETTGKIVPNSKRNSDHLDTRGARAVDWQIRGVRNAIVDRAIGNTDFDPSRTNRDYPDRHTHVALPDRTKFYWPILM